MLKMPVLMLLAVVVLLNSGCARLGPAAKTAAKSPRTWAPLVGAGLLHFDDMDDKISEWAYEENPIFGDMDDADDWSDAGQTVSWASAQLTLLAVDESWSDRTKDWVVMIGAYQATSGVTSVLKSTAERDRPLDQNDESFPSGHTSKTASAAAMGRYNLKRAGYGQWAPVFDGMVFMTAWARVEAGKHYPSDVLVGWALGNFIGETAALAFFDDPTLSFDVQVSPDVNYLGLNKRF